MKAVLLCAGKGTRIREITNGEKPKPMIEVNGKPLIEHTLDWLSNYDVEEVLINLHYKGDIIKEYFGPSYSGINIKYYWEDELLGTAGALTQMKEDLNSNFYVIYGDIITDVDLEKLHQIQSKSSSLGTVLVYNGEENLSEASIISLDASNNIEEFIEKPDKQTISKFNGEKWTNAGIYCLNPKILDYIGEEKDFSQDVFPEIIEDEKPLNAFKLPDEAYWHEVGNPERYRELKQDVQNSLINW